MSTQKILPPLELYVYSTTWALIKGCEPKSFLFADLLRFLDWNVNKCLHEDKLLAFPANTEMNRCATCNENPSYKKTCRFGSQGTPLTFMFSEEEEK